MICVYCHSEIEEYLIHIGQNPEGEIIRRYECILCGPVAFECEENV